MTIFKRETLLWVLDILEAREHSAEDAREIWRIALSKREARRFRGAKRGPDSAGRSSVDLKSVIAERPGVASRRHHPETRGIAFWCRGSVVQLPVWCRGSCAVHLESYMSTDLRRTSWTGPALGKGTPMEPPKVGTPKIPQRKKSRTRLIPTFRKPAHPEVKEVASELRLPRLQETDQDTC